MSLSPKDSERLKKVALEAVGLIVGGVVVKYVWKQDQIRGYVYHLWDTSGEVMVGLVKDGKEKVSEFSGRFVRTGDSAPEFALDDPEIEEEDIPIFEELFVESGEHQNPLQDD